MRTPIETAEKALARLMAMGADCAACGASQSELNELNADSVGFTLLRTTFDSALSLTMIKDHRRGTASVNDVSDEGIEKAVQECISAAMSATEDKNWGLCETPVQRDFQDGEAYDGDTMYTRADELLAAIKRDYPTVSLEMMTLAHRATHSAFVTSYGGRFTGSRAAYGLSLSFVAREGEKSSGFAYTGMSAYRLDKPLLAFDGVKKALDDTVTMVHTTPTEGKTEGTVVFTPQCLAEMLGFVADAYLSDTALIDGSSPWKDKLGRQVADPRITLRVAPHHPTIVGGERYTGEGFLAEDYDIIRDGVLQSFMLSLYAANKTGLKRAPASSFEVVMAPGDTPLAEMIAAIGSGIIVGGFSGGMPGPSGDFSGVAKNAFRIEKGRVAGAVSETMISGNLALMLQNLRGLSRETCATGDYTLPYMAVEGVTISGK